MRAWAQPEHRRLSLSSVRTAQHGRSERVTVTERRHAGAMKKNIDYQIIELAGPRLGAVSRKSLTDAGVSGTSISRRLEAGLLTSPFRGVYVVNALRCADTILHASGLAYPEGAVCRFSAASSHGFDCYSPNKPQFVTAKGSGAKSPDVRFHETRSLPSDDVVVANGLRITSPARTLCDISGSVPIGRLRHFTETQLTRSNPGAEELVACVQSRRRRGVAGVGHLAEILAFMLDDQPVPDSVLEMRLFDGLVSVGLTNLIRQFRPSWYDGIRGVVDIADPIGKTIIEADGRQFRQVTQAHNNDRQRDRKAAANGYLVLRIGYQELVSRRDSVLSEIRDVVIRRRAAATGSILAESEPA